MDWRAVHVIDPPVAVGVLIVTEESSVRPTTVRRSPAVTSNAGVVRVEDAMEPHPTVGWV